MRVLVPHVTSEPSRVTGLTSYLWSMLSAAAEVGDHHYVLVTPCNLSLVPEKILHARNISVVHSQSPVNETLASLWVSFRTFCELPSRNYDVIWNSAPIGVMWAARPVVTVVHDLYRVSHPKYYGWRKRMQWSIVTNRTISNADAIVSVSDATAQEVAAWYKLPSSRITTIHEASKYEGIGKLAPPPMAGRYILTVANFTPNKDLATLIEGYLRARELGLTLGLKIVGRDPSGILDREICKLARSGVEWYRDLSDVELERFYSGASLYLNTSIMEGFCLPILEAQSFGVPVVCSDIPVLREVAGGGAKYFRVGDGEDLAKHILEVVRSEVTWRELRDAASLNSASFSWASAARQMEAVLSEAAIARRNR